MCKHLLFVLELGQNITDIDYINICLHKKKGLCILKGLISIYLVKKKKHIRYSLKAEQIKLQRIWITRNIHLFSI